MGYDLSKKKVLITGSSRGIGEEIARLFAEHGARIAVHYNQDLARAQKCLHSLAGQGHFLVQADLSKPDSAKILVEKTLKLFGGIDILVNNAGIYEEHPVLETEYGLWKETWAKILQTNLISPADISFCLINHMKERGGCKIINVSSRGAFRGEPTAPAYGASKAGLNAMGQSLAKAVATKNIFVYTIAPGYVETDMAREDLDGPKGDSIRNQSPMGRVARPEEIAKTALFLASDGPEFLTGGIIDVNGASYLRS
jgi:NAD(P)-dependent dehydrogenase (short-subunit alcohol dehydrogenase family)